MIFHAKCSDLVHIRMAIILEIQETIITLTNRKSPVDLSVGLQEELIKVLSVLQLSSTTLAVVSNNSCQWSISSFMKKSLLN